MYRAFYGLAEPPFELNFDQKFVFATARHVEARGRVEEGLIVPGALTVLLGDAGVGKTTLLQASLRAAESQQIRCVHFDHPSFARESLTAALVAQLESDTPDPPASCCPLGRLRALLQDRRGRGLATALVIDEAEYLGEGALQEVGTLATMEAPEGPLLPIVLAAHGAFMPRFDRLTQALPLALDPRVCQLAPMELFETASYILWRVRAAGARGDKLFTREAVTHVHQCSGGIPGTINVLCDNALLLGYSRSARQVTRDVVVAAWSRVGQPA